MKIIGVTNRSISKDENSFLLQIERIVSAGIDGLILREKDLAAEEYEGLAR